MSEFQERLLGELRGRSKSEVQELNLDNARTQGSVEDAVTGEFAALEVLSLNNTYLTSLRGFPALKCLRKLDLADNRIHGGLERLVSCTKLQSLNLSNNKIKSFEVLEPLVRLGGTTSHPSCTTLVPLGSLPCLFVLCSAHTTPTQAMSPRTLIVPSMHLPSRRAFRIPGRPHT